MLVSGIHLFTQILVGALNWQAEKDTSSPVEEASPNTLCSVEWNCCILKADICFFSGVYIFSVTLTHSITGPESAGITNQISCIGVPIVQINSVLTIVQSLVNWY